MTNSKIRWVPLIGTLVLAGIFWFFTFYMPWRSFWLKISTCAAVLAGLSLWLQPDIIIHARLDNKAVVIGLVSAMALYFVFIVSRTLVIKAFPFAQEQIGEIYSKGQGTPLWTMAFLSFFVTGPSEELFWRGYVQRQFMKYFGQWQGWLVGTTLYAGVHFWSFTLTLVMAAMVAGSFWGALYWRFNNLWPVIISHSIWSVVVFVLLPMG